MAPQEPGASRRGANDRLRAVLHSLHPPRWARPWARRLATPAVRSLALGIAISVGVTILSFEGGLAGWETRALDTFLFFRDRVPSPEIVLVFVDDDAFRELGQRQPLSRRYLADLATFLLDSGARVVAFDVHLTATSTPEEDAALVAATRRPRESGRVVCTTVAVAREGGRAPRYMATTLYSPDLAIITGFANAPIAADGIVRRMLPVLPTTSGGYLPSFGLAVLAAHAGYAAVDLERALGTDNGTLTLPAGDSSGIHRQEAVSVKTLEHAAWRIDFTGKAGSFASFPAGALMAIARSGAPPDADNPFRGKIVLVGATFEESRDFYDTPVGRMPGVEIQANVIHTLLERRALLPPPWALNLALMVLGCIWISVASVRLRQIWFTALSAVLAAALVAASYEAYLRGYWLDFVPPLMVMRLYGKGSRALARRRLRTAFGAYVSKEAMASVERERPSLAGTLRTVSVLMSDVRGFTALSESLPPAQIADMMNKYFEVMIEVILQHQGMVNDFIGDGIFAVYNAPLDDPDHAWHAVASAQAMQAALERLNEKWRAEGRHVLSIGVAVHTGEVFAGTLGAAQRKKYTVVGDTVNTVARMEALNHDLGTEVLISGATRALVEGRVVLKDRGAVMLKDRAHPIQLYELLDAPDAADT